MVDEAPHWITAAIAKEILGVSGQWVYTLAQRGAIRTRRTDNAILFDYEDVLRYAERRIERMEEKLKVMEEARK